MFRLPGAASVEEALDQAEEVAGGRDHTVALYSQPSVPFCGTVEVVERTPAPDPLLVVTDLLEEARRLERAARELREAAEAVAGRRA
jgi:nucleotide-binding universal stress UspA family protein